MALAPLFRPDDPDPDPTTGLDALDLADPLAAHMRRLRLRALEITAEVLASPIGGPEPDKATDPAGWARWRRGRRRLLEDARVQVQFLPFLLARRQEVTGRDGVPLVPPRLVWPHERLGPITRAEVEAERARAAVGAATLGTLGTTGTPGTDAGDA
jgi:hypothetical protein